jgi:glycine oxidase
MSVNAPASRTADFATADVVIIGDGVIGLSTAIELCRAGASCILVGARRDGSASEAAAGLLAPSIGTLPGAVQPFFADSLDRYPAFVDSLRGFEPALRMVVGLIDVSADDPAAPRHAGVRLTASDLAALEPGVSAAGGGRFYATDGAIDNVLLVRALRRAVEAALKARVLSGDPVTSIELSGRPARVLLASGRILSSGTIVLAAGAWSAQIGGLPRSLPVTPLKGQMLAVASTALAHSVMSEDVYIVPRASELAIGATVERAGFDVGTSAGAIEQLRRAAIDVCPAIEGARVIRTWAGIRPATPDMLPIIGADPSDPRLIYACGHSKNGILLAPATAVAVAALATGARPSADLAPFSIRRFEN